MTFVPLLFNIQKRTNLGQIIRTANALGAGEICLVGKRKFSSYGDQGTAKGCRYRHFYSVTDAVEHYKVLGFDIVGVEITPDGVSVNQHEFVNDTVFILGNETTGMHEDTLKLCDYCTYIPQFGDGASVNVNVAAGVVFNAFQKDQNRHNGIVGNKFVGKAEGER